MRLTPMASSRSVGSTAELARLNENLIAADLRKKLKGEVRFDEASKGAYSTDASNYRQIPIGVVIPKDTDDILHTIEVCRAHGAPVLSRGGGTSLAGQCCNIAVVMDFSKYINRILELNPHDHSAWVEPGIVLDELNKEACKHGLIIGPDPATHTHCTLGGMLGNNSCGAHAQMAGKMIENTEELDIVLYDGTRMKVGRTSDLELARIIQEGGRKGQIYLELKKLRDRYADLIREKFPRIPRRVSGYNLDQLLPESGFNVARALVGTESTCVTILSAKVRLVPDPAHRTKIALGFKDIFTAADWVPRVNEHHPIALEGLDDVLISDAKKKGSHTEAMQYLPEGDSWLIVEFGARNSVEGHAKALALAAHLKLFPGAPSVRVLDEEQGKKIWDLREAGLGSTARVPGQEDTWEGWEDSAVAPEQLGSYLRGLKALYKKYHYKGPLYGHFGHGCVHTRINFDFLTQAGIQKYRAFIEEATTLVVQHGGSFSGEHGDGQSKAEFYPKMFGHELTRAFGEFKAIWDPEGKMNPGKMSNPYRIDENLRLGKHYNPPILKTHFKFPEDKGSMPYAALRCVGIGKCRRHEGGTMCPSYMATRDEIHSTRGRAHLLFEMFQGDVVTQGWKSEAVKEALGLCLSCKGCKKDCPMNVDMATYKSEFLSHYYKGRKRPLSAYAFGLIDVWARLGSNFPRVVNIFTQTPVLRQFAKKLSGMDSRRKIPPFAQRTFKDWHRNRPIQNEGRPQVILWADTFNNYFHPKTAIAAVEVLESAGFQVLVPQGHLCCGRPLYDYGMLDQAKSYLKKIIASLRPAIEAGIPVIGLEPSCVSVFRDELKGLLPNDQDGARLSKQTFMLSEFLEERAKDFKLPQLHAKAIVQIHCHHKSVLKVEAETWVMKRMGLDFEVLQSGCCGMAGSFGFEREKDHYEVSQKIAEQILLPAVRSASEDTLILADGFSCRTQIEQGSRRKPFHLAEVIQMAIRENKNKQKKEANSMEEKKENELYDVSETFVSALAQSRVLRGDPPEEVAEVSGRRSLLFGAATLLGIVGLSVYLTKRERGEDVDRDQKNAA
jgi:FAD/FMN-containing dehydrogenase/Fe-S oxidoreductase